MSINISDLEKTINSALTTTIKKSEINFEQLYIEVEVENLISAILFLKTNEKCKFKQLMFIEWIKTNPVPLNQSVNYLTNSREIALLAISLFFIKKFRINVY